MQVNRGLLIPFLLLIIIQIVGHIFSRIQIVGAVAVYSLIFTLTFLGLFLLAYISTAFSAYVNPWTSNVREMEGPCFNPMYTTWLFENDRRMWAAYITFMSVLILFLLDWFPFYIITGGNVTFENSFYAYMISFTYLVVLAIFWYKSFCKLNTRQEPVDVPEYVEAEWSDKRL